MKNASFGTHFFSVSKKLSTRKNIIKFVFGADMRRPKNSLKTACGEHGESERFCPVEKILFFRQTQMRPSGRIFLFCFSYYVLYKKTKETNII